MINKKEFLRYENLRKSGIMNMFMVNSVCKITGLTREQVLEIQEKYEVLANKYL